MCSDRRHHPPALDDPFQPDGGLTIVRGNLAPDGAVIKTAAASPQLLKHTGPAAVLKTRAAQPDGLRVSDNQKRSTAISPILRQTT